MEAVTATASVRHEPKNSFPFIKLCVKFNFHNIQLLSMKCSTTNLQTKSVIKPIRTVLNVCPQFTSLENEIGYMEYISKLALISKIKI